MTTHLILVLLAATLDRSTAIEQMRKQGEIDAETALVYQALTYRDPDQLPEELRQLSKPRVNCATVHFVEAFQRNRELSSWAAGMLKQSIDRPPSAGYYDSSIYPIRSHYTTNALSDRAAAILDYVEESWQFQVDTVGFNPPVGDLGEGGSAALDFYVGDAWGAGGYTVPEYEWDATAISDCASWVIISQDIPDGGSLQSTVAHEFNHVLQAAHDCYEWLAFWENSATFMMDLTYDSVDDYLWFIPDFQQYPYLPFEYHDGTGSAYQYGGVLVPMVLDEAFGIGDGVAVRQVWQQSEQTGWDNEPDYFDAIVAVTGDLDAFQTALTEWRYLTGSRDDGYHLSEAGWWDSYCDYCEPPDDATFTVAQMPVSQSVNTGVYGHGSSYVRVNLSGQTGNLSVSFSGGGGTRWAASVICSGTGRASVTAVSGDSVIPVFGRDFCTLAVSNLYQSGYDPDDDFETLVAGTHSFSYTIDFESTSLPPPSITSVTPTEVSCTSPGDGLISGQNFIAGLTVEVGGVAAYVGRVVPNEIIFTPPQRTSSTTVDVTVINPDTQRATRQNALTYAGAGCTGTVCECDLTYGCDAGCPCDLGCSACLCDTSFDCDDDCSCDPECDGSGGCDCGAGEGVALLPLLVLLRRRRRQ